jgi:hypothetical protein
MFYKDRETLLEVLTKMQREHCQYDMFSFDPSRNPPDFCDCKYGYNKRGEQTGCPELRCIVQLLSNITDDEFYDIMDRS